MIYIKVMINSRGKNNKVKKVCDLQKDNFVGKILRIE